VTAARNRDRPADRAVDLGKRGKDLQRRREIELEPAMTARHQHPEDANCLQRFDQTGRDAT
jgi:hypothetical protein